jgi:predicted extracellular nuclease
MKNFTTILFALLVSSAAMSQVFDNDFTTWTENTPNGWVGAKTNLDLANVTQVSNDGGQGDFAVQLANTESSHKRFTTLPLTVENGTNYSITFWARGTGEIRTGLFDNRADAAGYVYNSYVVLNSTEWTSYTQNVVAATDEAISEFILSIRNTTAPNHVQVDRVLIETQELQTVPIYDIQFTSDMSGDSPLAGQSVITGGIVTAVGVDGYFIQNSNTSGPWNGIFVFNSFNAPVIGDSVVFSANVVEYFNMTQLSGVSSFTIVSSGNAVNVTNITTAAVNTEGYEGMLVRVNNANCVDGNSGFGQFIVNDGSGDALVSPTIFEYDGLTGVVYNITGVIFYNFEEFKIMPRSAADVEVSTGINDLENKIAVNLFPNPVVSHLRVEMDAANFTATEYVLVDAAGKVVKSGLINQPSQLIDLSNLTAGFYNLNLRGKNIWQSEKVLIQR